MTFIFFTPNTGTDGTGVRTQVPIEGLKWESEYRTLKDEDEDGPFCVTWHLKGVCRCQLYRPNKDGTKRCVWSLWRD
jgi:hypothetical protein